MARNNDRDRAPRRAPKDTGRRTKKKVCIFCKDQIDLVDYKDVNLLRKFMSDRGKIRARRVSGNCAQHQRDVGGRDQDAARARACCPTPSGRRASVPAAVAPAVAVAASRVADRGRSRARSRTRGGVDEPGDCPSRR